MAEVVILGLPWLAKWSPKVHWEKTMKRVVMKRRSPDLLGEKKGVSIPERKKKGNPECSKAMSEQEEEEQTVPREY